MRDDGAPASHAPQRQRETEAMELDATPEEERMKIVIALGGNALGNSLFEQMEAVRVASKSIADLIEAGHQVALTHGNGPQVGMINQAFGEYYRTTPGASVIPMSVCVGMSQGYIGYDLQNALREELRNRGIQKSVATLITQVRVDEDDPAFLHRTKPIGRFLTKEEADDLTAKGYHVIEDSGRGYRRVVASPRPKEIIEIDIIRDLLADGQVVIAAGGGGIPVVDAGSNHLKGMGAVIDKDFTGSLMARQLEADCFFILTAVEKVAIHFGRPEEQWLDTMTCSQALQYASEGQFGEGSMRPKVEAAAEFAASGQGRFAIITHLHTAGKALEGKTGTRIFG